MSQGLCNEMWFLIGAASGAVSISLVHKGQIGVISGTANAITITERGRPNFQ
jgi:hypothetical protein